MNLKEAFRYQNFLEQKISTLTAHLTLRTNVVSVSQLHKRHDANPDVENELIDATPERSYDAAPDELAAVLCTLLREKELCALAVTHAKTDFLAECGFDLDAQLAVNRARQSVAKVFSALGNYKETKRVAAGTGYKFNAEGVQAPYRYDIEETMTPVYDVLGMKVRGKEMLAKADEVSAKADKCMIEAELDFTPLFSPTDSIEDIIETTRREIFDTDEAV